MNSLQERIERAESPEIRNRSEKIIWDVLKIPVYIFGLLALFALVFGYFAPGLKLVIATVLLTFGFKLALKRYFNICRNGKAYPAVINEKRPSYQTSHPLINYSATVNIENKKINVSFSLHNPKAFTISTEKGYRLPVKGDELLLYYDERYPKNAFPPVTELTN